MRLQLKKNFSLIIPLIFSLLNLHQYIDLIKIRTSDFYKLFNTETHTTERKGPQKWNNYFLTKEGMWKKRFASVKTLRKEPKLKEFQFKFMHRIVVTKRELFR